MANFGLVFESVLTKAKARYQPPTFIAQWEKKQSFYVGPLAITTVWWQLKIICCQILKTITSGHTGQDFDSETLKYWLKTENFDIQLKISVKNFENWEIQI